MKDAEVFLAEIVEKEPSIQNYVHGNWRKIRTRAYSGTGK